MMKQLKFDDFEEWQETVAFFVRTHNALLAKLHYFRTHREKHRQAEF